MQFLSISSDETLSSLADKVGKKNVPEVLVANQLNRTRNIGEQFVNMCNDIAATAKDVTAKQKISILNTFTSDGDVFEAAALLGESSWKVLNKLGTMPGFVRIPETIDPLPNSADILGGRAIPVAKTIYTRVMKCLNEFETVSSEIFNEWSTSSSVTLSRSDVRTSSPLETFAGFKLPWGKIQLYSSLADDVIDFPVYPEELRESRNATYVTMPDLIYQYEPWQTYQSSGPRTQEYTFHFHRDMWSGNHLDGKANQLIRFCEANCYARYSGSAVYSATVRMYINGVTHIAGVLNSVDVHWSGPIGRDGWYLDCELTLNITEVSDEALSFDTVRTMGLIGGHS